MKTFRKIATIMLLVALVAVMAGTMIACDKKVITVGYTIYEPMNYKDADGNLVGFDTDLAKAVFEELGYEVNFKEIKWENKYIELSSNSIDCIWNGFTANAADDDGIQRSDKVDFTYNYMKNAQAVVIKTADAAKYTSTTSFAGAIGCAEDGSAGETYANTFTGAVVTPVTSQVAALLQVDSQAADFAVVDYQLANSVVGKGDYADMMMVTALEAGTEYYAIGFAKGSDLTAQVNATLEKFAEDGTLLAIAEKYGVAGSVITDFSDQK